MSWVLLIILPIFPVHYLFELRQELGYFLLWVKTNGQKQHYDTINSDSW